EQEGQFGYLNPDRSVTPVNALLDGSTTQDGLPLDTRVHLRGTVNTASVYATDTFSVGRGLTFTVSGRYNRTTVANRDRIDPSGPASLNGEYACARLNPAVGATYSGWH